MTKLEAVGALRARGYRLTDIIRHIDVVPPHDDEVTLAEFDELVRLLGPVANG